MRRDTILPPVITGAAPGGRAQVTFDPGYRYHKLLLTHTGVTIAQMTALRLLLNGDEAWSVSAVDLNAMNDQSGAKPKTGSQLMIPFDYPKLKTRDFEENFAMNMSSRDANGKMIDNMRLEIELAAGSYTPDLSIAPKVSGVLPGGPGPITRIQTRQFSFASAGTYTINDIAPGITGLNDQYQFIRRVFFMTDAMTALEVRRGTQIKFQRTLAENNGYQGDANVREPQTNMYVYDPTEEGYVGEMLELSNRTDTLFKITLDAAATFNVVTEFVGAL